MEHLVQQIRGAWQRAKNRQSTKCKGDEEDPVYHFMRLPLYRNAMLPMVWKLQEVDAADFQSGEWFAGKNYSKRGTFQGTFNKLVERAEKQLEGFRWSSWMKVDK